MTTPIVFYEWLKNFNPYVKIEQGQQSLLLVDNTSDMAIDILPILSTVFFVRCVDSSRFSSAQFSASAHCVIPQLMASATLTILVDAVQGVSL